MCIGDATAQQTRPGLSCSLDKVASISLSTLLTFHVIAMELLGGDPVGAPKARCGSDRLDA
jgi:hypothetical protein